MGAGREGWGERGMVKGMVHLQPWMLMACAWSHSALGGKYSSAEGATNKRNAEHMAALVCIRANDL